MVTRMCARFLVLGRSSLMSLASDAFANTFLMEISSMVSNIVGMGLCKPIHICTKEHYIESCGSKPVFWHLWVS